MFSKFTPELDAGFLWEYMKDRKNDERVNPDKRPRNVPSYHWWWFVDYNPPSWWSERDKNQGVL